MSTTFILSQWVCFIDFKAFFIVDNLYIVFYVIIDINIFLYKPKSKVTKFPKLPNTFGILFRIYVVDFKVTTFHMLQLKVCQKERMEDVTL